MLQNDMFGSIISNISNAFSRGGIQFKVKTEDLLSTASEISVKVNEMMNRISAISEKTVGTSEYWEGDTAEKRRETFNIYRNNITDALNRLSLYVETLQGISGNYTEAESQNTEEAQALPTDVIS